MNYIDRLNKEKNGLQDKIDLLDAFIYEDGGIYDNLDKCEKVRLAQQLSAMVLYRTILDDRLQASQAESTSGMINDE